MKKVLGAIFALCLVTTSLAVHAAEPTVDQCTIIGTEGDDDLVGTEANDVICGLGGNDSISGGAGNDTIYAGAGNDEIFGNDGDDTIFGGAGDDDLSGNAGNDAIDGSTGADNLFGNDGSDSLSGGDGVDGLVGGADNDELQGGAGKDICVVDAGDTYDKKDCYFDKKAPSVTAISVDAESENLDVTADNRTVNFSATILDQGTGLKSVNFAFSPKSKQNSGNDYSGSLNITSLVDCTELVTTNCRTSGNAQRGTYHFTLQLMKNSLKGVHVLSTLRLTDAVGNIVFVEGSSIAKVRRQISVNQNGTPDRTAPSVTNIEVIGDTQLDTWLDYAMVRVSFTDPGSELKDLSIAFLTPESGNNMSTYSMNLPYGGASALKPCTETHLPSVACLYSGDLSNGVIEVGLTVSIPQMTWLYRAQKLVPSYVHTEDTTGNQKGVELSRTFKQRLTLYKTWATAPYVDGDLKAPVLKSFKVSTKNINTAGGDATFTVTARLTDSGVGINRYGSAVSIEVQSQTAEPIECMKTAATGTAKDATFTFSCTVPAHAADGVYSLSITATDMAKLQNTLEYGVAELAASRFQSTITNG